MVPNLKEVSNVVAIPFYEGHVSTCGGIIGAGGPFVKWVAIPFYEGHVSTFVPGLRGLGGKKIASQSLFMKGMFQLFIQGLTNLKDVL